ncbi:helix-turn-helix domain-containing protein [Natrialba sp. INN-245]|uniref:helix-turn-helix domain-containing protein n=1 Tax=Natrialba sp. INN-245 TaxID=2690967 RepID=UPI00131038A4|nr:helix-turn-helix domain-containing protein [Natrialba sp. INN-245]MWV40216.1 hypothetical protein [Natrialba sp. INN-245]
MKFARVQVSLRQEQNSPIHTALADTEASDTVRVRYGGFNEDGPRTYVCSVTGENGVLETRLEATEGILEHEIIHRRPGYALFYVVSALHEYELWLQRLFTQESLTMIPPVDLRTDRRFVFRIIGRSDDLQRAVGDAGERLPLDVERVGDYNQPDERVTASLTNRQIDAVEAALETGYYASPRESTTEDVASVLGCAPSTAAEHLRKAEAALVRTVFESDMFE